MYSQLKFEASQLNLCIQTLKKELCGCYTDELPSHHPPSGIPRCTAEQSDNCALPLLFKAKIDLDQGKLNIM